MPEPQYLSTDPNAGQYLSTDPNAGGGDSYKGPDTFWGGFGESLKKDATTVLQNIPIGAAKTLDPRNLGPGILKTAALAAFGSGAVPFVGPKPEEIAALQDPATGGQAIGGLITGLVGGRVPMPTRALGAVGEGLNTAGRALEKVPGGGIKTKLAAAALQKVPGRGPVGDAHAPNASGYTGGPVPTAPGEVLPQFRVPATPAEIHAGPAFTPEATKLATPPVREIPPDVQPAPAVSPKMKLSADQVAQMLRDQYGSEKAGRMLYGKAQGELSAADRQAAIKRLAPGASKLPEAAKVRIEQGVQEGTPSAAWRYIQDAPNALAREFLIKLMRGK